MFPSNDYSYKDLIAESTGSSSGKQGQKRVVVSHGQYEIVVRLTEDGRFVDVDELRIKRDFLSPEQRVAGSGYFNVDEFYEEE